MTISYPLIIARLILDPPKHPLLLTTDPSMHLLNNRITTVSQINNLMNTLKKERRQTSPYDLTYTYQNKVIK